MRNQISGSFSVDVSSLADAIAERLQSPAGPVLTEVPQDEAARIVASLLAEATGLFEHRTAVDMLEHLAATGFVLARRPARQPVADAWFGRSED